MIIIRGQVDRFFDKFPIAGSSCHKNSLWAPRGATRNQPQRPGPAGQQSFFEPSHPLHGNYINLLFTGRLPNIRNDFGSFDREMVAPVWSFSNVFILTNLVIKSLQKIWFKNIQNRRPHGSLIKHGGFWDFWLCRASADDQGADISS